jgi:hypothetical protein
VCNDGPEETIELGKLSFDYRTSDFPRTFPSLFRASTRIVFLPGLFYLDLPVEDLAKLAGMAPVESSDTVKYKLSLANALKMPKPPFTFVGAHSVGG